LTGREAAAVKKWTVLALAVLLALFPACGAPQPPEKGTANYANAFTDVGYVKPNDWQNAQGMTFDGECFYFAGHNDKTGELADIHVIDATAMTERGVLERKGPLHSAELDDDPESGTLFACTGGEGRKAAVWELSPADGTKLGEWDFGTVGYQGAALVCCLGNRTVALLTSVEEGAKFAVAKIRLGAGGDYEVLDEWRYDTGPSFGVPQGLDSRDGKIYYLADAGAKSSADPHYLYLLRLNADGVISYDRRYLISIPEETEGLCVCRDGTVYFGTAKERIYRLNAKLDGLIPCP
jgi:hypothetical protein